MILQEILIPTRMARPGMQVIDVFKECVAKGVHGIPFCDHNDKITGRISIRHVFREVCVPQDVVSGAHMLGDQIGHLDLPDIEKCQILGLPVERFVLDNIPSLTPNSPAVKAIAIMEKYGSSYLFVIDDEYRGVVTRFGITSLLIKHWDVCAAGTEPE
jgi:CBS domain-containing protein